MKVGIIGASGYTGQELVRILAGHPKVEITVATSERFAGSAIGEIFPSLQSRSFSTSRPIANFAFL